MNGSRISDVVDENIGAIVVDEDVGRHGLLRLRRREQHGGDGFVPRPFQFWRKDLIIGRDVVRLDFHLITIVDDEGVSDDVLFAALNIICHVFKEVPVDVIVKVEVVVGLFNPVPQIMRDVEADRIHLLSFVEQLDGVVILHDSLLRDAREFLLAVDQGGNLIRDRLAVGAKFLVPWLRVAVKARRGAGAGH